MKRKLLTILVLGVALVSSVNAGYFDEPEKEEVIDKDVLIAYATDVSKELKVDPRYALAVLKGGEYKSGEVKMAFGSIEYGGVMKVLKFNTAEKWDRFGHKEDNTFWKENGGESKDFFKYEKSIKTGVRIISYCVDKIQEKENKNMSMGDCYGMNTKASKEQLKLLDEVNNGK